MASVLPEPSNSRPWSSNDGIAPDEMTSIRFQRAAIRQRKADARIEQFVQNAARIGEDPLQARRQAEELERRRKLDDKPRERNARVPAGPRLATGKSRAGSGRKAALKKKKGSWICPVCHVGYCEHRPGRPESTDPKSYWFKPCLPEPIFEFMERLKRSAGLTFGDVVRNGMTRELSYAELRDLEDLCRCLMRVSSRSNPNWKKLKARTWSERLRETLVRELMKFEDFRWSAWGTKREELAAAPRLAMPSILGRGYLIYYIRGVSDLSIELPCSVTGEQRLELMGLAKSLWFRLSNNGRVD